MLIKQFSTILILTLLTVSCKQPDKKKAWFNNIPKTDTTCLNEIEKAKTTIQKNKLVYCHNTGNLLWIPLRAEKEMDSLIKIFNISYKNTSSPCVVLENKTYNCYCKYMQDQIDLRFGKKFTDSLLYIADSIYISKNLHDTYDYTSWDTPPVFPGDKSFDSKNHFGLQSLFESKIIYNAEKYGHIDDSTKIFAFVDINLNIDQRGKAKVIKQNLVFWGEENKQKTFEIDVYEKAKKLLVSLIEQTVWTPSTIKKMNVKSDNDITVYFYYK